jgi:hypothetical protein
MARKGTQRHNTECQRCEGVRSEKPRAEVRTQASSQSAPGLARRARADMREESRQKLLLVYRLAAGFWLLKCRFLLHAFQELAAIRRAAAHSIFGGAVPPT